MTSAPVMTGFPAARAARIRGVSAGKATTSKTARAASICPGENARASASAPFMPSGVTLTMIASAGGGSACTQRYPYLSASAGPAVALRASTVTSPKPASRNAATTALAMPPEPRTRTGAAGSSACRPMSALTAS
jgi:hypothetical protein